MDQSDPNYMQAMAKALMGDSFSPGTQSFVNNNLAAPPVFNFQSAQAMAPGWNSSPPVQSNPMAMPSANDPGMMAAQAQLRALGLVQ
jgi:hypothetical protein